tara:strand:- start:8170 stop:9054 length:885 start_codon:yes stop_codon:yes gene_type:complete
MTVERGGQLDTTPLDLTSLPRAREAIDETYRLAFRIVQSFRVISCYSLDWHSVTTVSYWEDQPEAQEDHWNTLNDKGDELNELLAELEENGIRHRELFARLLDMYQTFVHEDLGDFVTGEKNWGRSTYPAIQTIGWDVKRWGRQCLAYYRARWDGPITSKHREQFEKCMNNFPMTFDLESKIRSRLYSEQGKLKKAIPKARNLYRDSAPELSETEKRKSIAIAARLHFQETYGVKRVDRPMCWRIAKSWGYPDSLTNDDYNADMGDYTKPRYLQLAQQLLPKLRLEFGNVAEDK